MQPLISQQQNLIQSQLQPQHNIFKFNQPKQPNILFNSCFDSGNIFKVNRNSYDNYSIWTASDAQEKQNQGYTSWFYFQVSGFINRKVFFNIHKVYFLWAVSKKQHLYRPVYKVFTKSSQEKQQNIIQTQVQSQWLRLPHPITSFNVNDQQQLVLKFDFSFKKQYSRVRFAFLYPYEYEQSRNDILKLKQLYQINQDKQIFFKQYQLMKSYQKRVIDLIIISSHEGRDNYENIKYDQYFDLNQKLVKFRDNKPIIFISARVHPIETPSSFCMNGVIKFLLDKKDLRAYLLRKYFVFVLVPMLNPDGVANGYCRMDCFNQNLNRYYKTPDPIKQPSCYAVRKFCQHYQKDKRMFMYLDLHAHPAHKGNFMFGNAIYDFVQQVQSQLFPKILSQNCINFQFQNCIFSRKHMKAKDRNQDMNKQGCGRVVLYKDFGIPHAYTLECGYHVNLYNNVIEDVGNKEAKYIVRYKVNQSGVKIYETAQRVWNQENILKVEQSIIKEKQKIVEKEKKCIMQVKSNSNIKNENSNNDHPKSTIQVNETVFINQQKSLNISLNKTITKLQQVKNLKRYSNITNVTISNRSNLPAQKYKLKPIPPSYHGYDIFQCTSSPMDNITSSYYARQIPMYNIQAYQNLGRNIMISILDIFKRNPYSRGIDLDEKRKEIAQKQAKLDRFRKQQAGIMKKMKNIVQLIEEQFYSQWYKRNVFNFIINTNGNNNTNANNTNNMNSNNNNETSNMFVNKSRRNHTAINQYQIKNSQSKARQKQKQKFIQKHLQKHLSNNPLFNTALSQSPNQLLLQSQIIKNSSLQYPQSSSISSLNKLSQQHPKQYQNYSQKIIQSESKNILISKKIKTMKNRQKGTIKQLSIKDSMKDNMKDELIKKTIPLPYSQHQITMEEEIKYIKNQAESQSYKNIKHMTYNLANLKSRNLIVQGNNKNMMQNYAMQPNLYGQAQSLGTQSKK